MNAPAHTSVGIRSALEYIQGVFGPSFFPVNPGRLMAWSDQLRDLDDAQLIQGARIACANAQRGQPPMPGDILAAVVGRWTVEKRRATDCHGNVTPDCPIESFHVLRSVDGSVIRCFDERLNLVDYGSQRHIASAARVRATLAHLLPPATTPALQASEPRQIATSGAPDFHAGIPQ